MKFFILLAFSLQANCLKEYRLLSEYGGKKAAEISGAGGVIGGTCGATLGGIIGIAGGPGGGIAGGITGLIVGGSIGGGVPVSAGISMALRTKSYKKMKRVIQGAYINEERDLYENLSQREGPKHPPLFYLRHFRMAYEDYSKRIQKRGGVPVTQSEFANIIINGNENKYFCPGDNRSNRVLPENGAEMETEITLKDLAKVKRYNVFLKDLLSGRIH